MIDFTHRCKLLNYAVRIFATAFLFFASLTSRAQTPVASFSADSTVGCVPLTVHFTNTSLLATNYFWDFGNGNTSVLPNPTTVYTSPGFYTVSLTATNSSSGQSDVSTLTNYIHVVSYPTAAFSGTPLSGCAGNTTVTFTNNSINSTNYIWDFGDGTSSTLTNPVHNYNNPGLYTVKLIAYASFGCNQVLTMPSYINVHPNPVASITATPTSSCNPAQVFSFSCPSAGITSYLWNFGDGTTSILAAPTHVYGATGTYTVSLVVQNQWGCTDSVIMNNLISIGASLVPSFTVSDSSGCVPFVTQFNCNVAGATSWSWSFGDGTTSTQQNPSHTYSASGNYSITLTVTTTSGCNGTITIPNLITVDNLPTVSFNATNGLRCAPATVHFTNSSSGAAGGYYWEFGDGDTSTAATPNHIYTSAGTYTVTLHAYSANGCEATLVRNNFIVINDADAHFTGAPKQGCVPLPVSFTPTSTVGIASYSWAFGDPGSGAANISAIQSPSHTYNNLGQYSVQLIVTTTAGCKDTVVKTNYILVAPSSVVYTVPDTIVGCQPFSVSFTNPLLGSSVWHWDFGIPWLTNDTSNTANPTYTFDSAGVYTVTLVSNMYGNNGLGCQQIFQPAAIVHVMPLILSPITYVQATPCAPFSIHFSDTTANVVHWDWDFGDGTPHDTTQFPIHIYTSPGTYTVSLQVATASGCLTSLGTTITVGVPNPIQVNTHNTCYDDTIQFTLGSAALFSSWSWNFGDGTPSTSLQNPKHVYGQGGTFVISLSTTTVTGCVYTYHDTIYTEQIVPSFTVSGLTQKCHSLFVTFNNTTIGANSFLWDFNDPFSPTDTSTVTSPTYFFHNQGTYNVTLTAYGNFCTKTVTFPSYITIFEAWPNFTWVQSSNCFPLTVTFTDVSSPVAVTWNWNFGDGSIDSVQNPVHTFYGPPTNPVSLTIVDINGCTKTKSLYVLNYLQAHFTTADTAGCRPYTVHFSDSSDAGATGWQWFFGDGTTSTQQNPVHIYTQDSLYTVTLVTTFSSGCSDTIVMPNYINVGSPHANFNTTNASGCAPVLVQFNNTSTNAVSYYWDFGDGATSTLPVTSHIYNIPGYYTVTLLAYSSSGCVDTLVRTNYIYIPGTYSYFTLASTLNCLGNNTCFVDSSINAISWQWNFGDGYTDTVADPCHLYTDTGSYTVSLITTDSLGCQSFYTFPNPINVNPNAAAGGVTIDTVGCNPYTVSFFETSMYEVSNQWHFGDGTTDTSANPVHIYQNAGIYNPYIVAFNSNGCADTFYFSNPITVHQTPTAQFSSSPNSGCTPLSVQMSNTSFDTVNVIYSWSFGNGNTSAAYSPSTVYIDSSVYTISLIVTNDNLCRDTATQQVTVHLSPTANASTTDTVGCTPHNVLFNNNSIYATNYLWSFGDGNTSTNQNPVHIYTSSGTYFVTLISYNQFGCSDTFHFANPIIVNQSPNAQFSSSTLSGCTTLNVQFTNNSIDTLSPVYNWTFGNGLFSNSISPGTAYPDSGVYNVSLVVTNSNNCRDTAIAAINVHLTPTAIATATDTTGCTPFLVTFINQSTNATIYNWNFGDGFTSPLANPSHTFGQGGIYSVTLIASTSFGCTDTFSFPYSFHVDQSPIAQFATSVASGCTDLTVGMINNTTDTINAIYAWNFGNGTTSTLFAPSTIYTDSALYSIYLTVTNSNGCVDRDTQFVTVYLSPAAIASTNDTSGCSPYSVAFSNNTINANSYYWDFGDGTNSAAVAPSHIYTSGGIYNPYMVAYNSAGCNDTIYLPVIDVKQTPTANFGAIFLAACSGITFDLLDSSTNTINPSYNWAIGSSITSTNQNPSVVLTSPGFYDITLIITNQNGCSDTLTQTNYLQVYDTIPPPADPLLSVSVLNNTQVEITWANSAVLDLGAYKIWRFDQATSSYINVYTDNNPVNSSFNPTSKYTDSGLNTLPNVYTYKVQTLDRCSYALPLSMLNAHTTINVSAQAVVNDIHVSWTPYGGCGVNTYEINRVEVANGSSTLIATVPSTQLNYNDTALPCPINYSYRITATDLCGNPYTSLSDTAIAQPDNILKDQQAVMTRSTVVNNQYVLTEWAEPSLHPERVIGYNILRSKDTVSTHYGLLATVPAYVTSYEDYDVNVMEENFYYKINVVNDCNLTGAPSTNSSSILLQSQWQFANSHLWWTEYDKWDNGVQKYTIEKYNWDTGQWEEIKTVPGNTTVTDIDE
jgi:PKD repeat protein